MSVRIGGVFISDLRLLVPLRVASTPLARYGRDIYVAKVEAKLVTAQGLSQKASQLQTLAEEDRW